MMINMGDRAFRLIPYRDTAARIASAQTAETQVINTFVAASLGTPRVREGYWYDLQQAGASAYNGSNQIAFASGSNSYGFPDMVVLAITVPTAKVFSIYGIADYTADPALQAIQIKQGSVSFPIIYLSPDIYTNEDHKAIFNSAMPAVKPNGQMTITLYGTSSSTDKIDILFKLAEEAADL
jgi:hypothetical protein